MSRDRKLTENELGIIEALAAKQHNPTEIALHIGRSRKAVRNALDALRHPQDRQKARQKIAKKVECTTVWKAGSGRYVAKVLVTIVVELHPHVYLYCGYPLYFALLVRLPWWLSAEPIFS